MAVIIEKNVRFQKKNALAFEYGNNNTTVNFD